MVGWIKMKLGMEIGLGPSQIVLDGDPAAPIPICRSLFTLEDNSLAFI